MIAKSIKRQLILLLFSTHIVLLLALFSLTRESVVLATATVTLAMSTGVVRTFFPILHKAFTLNGNEHNIDGPDLVAIAAIMKSLALAVLSGWIVVGKLWTGDIPGIKDSYVLIYVLFVSATGGILYMASEGALKGAIPREEWIRAGKWVSAGVFLAVIVLLAVEYIVREVVL